MHTTEWDRDLLRDTLHEIMERADLNQAAVGKLAGRDRTMANRWLKGQHQPTYEAAARFASAIAEQHPQLSDMAQRFLSAAGYPQASEPDPVTATASGGQPNSPEDALRELRKIARDEDKSIGDILVERGLATPDELTLSDEKRHDTIVRDILASDLPQKSKNAVLLDYVGRRRHHHDEPGIAARDGEDS